MATGSRLLRLRVLFRMGSVIVAFAVAGTACTPFRAPSSKLSRAERQKCSDNGGTVDGRGMFGTMTCVIPFSDAGKACHGDDECAGLCLIDAGDTLMPIGNPTTGYCQPDNAHFGCFAQVEAGRVATPFMCYD